MTKWEHASLYCYLDSKGKLRVHEVNQEPISDQPSKGPLVEEVLAKFGEAGFEVAGTVSSGPNSVWIYLKRQVG